MKNIATYNACAWSVSSVVSLDNAGFEFSASCGENNVACDAIGTRWEKAGEQRARLYIPTIGALLGAPAFFMVVASPSFYASMFFLFLE